MVPSAAELLAYPFAIRTCPCAGSGRLEIDDQSTRGGGLAITMDGADIVAAAHDEGGLRVLRVDPRGHAVEALVPRDDSSAHSAARALVRKEPPPGRFQSITDGGARLVLRDYDVAIGVVLGGTFEGSALLLEITASEYRVHLSSATSDRVLAVLPAHPEACGPDESATLPLEIVCARATSDGEQMVILLGSEPARDPLFRHLVYVDLAKSAP